MHLRRALLLFALVLGLTALAASIAPAPRGGDGATVPPPPVPATAPSRGVSVTLRFPPPRSKTPLRTVAPGSHLVVQVVSSAPGEATIPGLGRTDAGTPAAPARFDVVVPDSGRYPVMFQPADAAPATVGTLAARVSGSGRRP